MTNEVPAAPGASARHGAPSAISHRHQQGVVLLALILVVLVGSSALLLGKLNERAQVFAREVQTQAALRQAKQALIQYAVSYPELHEDSDRIPGPGYLPCPDQDPGIDYIPGSGADQREDMVGETNCAESTGTTVGRLPTRDLGLDNLVDAAGERLWYAVAQEYKLNQLSRHVMNSETPASLRVDGGAEEIVAVVIAPGAPIDGQDGRGTALDDLYDDPVANKTWRDVVAEYLEDDNATNTDGEFVTAPTAAGSPPACTDGSLDDEEIKAKCFNDQLITITRQELMAAVEARVANDVRAALVGYRNVAGGAFPWLAPFSDPKRGGRHAASIGGYGLSGRHTSTTTNSVMLTDSNADFVASGVAADDRLWNVTDGSYATISAVTATTVTVGALTGGTDNNYRFDEDDVYYIEAAALNLAALFNGTAGPSSAGTTLDAGVDLEQFGVVPGDIVDNLTDGTSGSVIAVDHNTVTLNSSPVVEFDLSDEYRVRSPAAGVSSVGSSGLTLVDQNMEFNTAGVLTGDLVRNITDGSQGVVVSIPDAQTLTVSSLYGGANNSFTACNGTTIPCDSYALIRQIPETNTRYGLLPVHEYGKPFGSEFSVQWSLLSANGNTISVSAPGGATTYTTAITNWIQRSTLYSDSTGTDTSYPDAVTANSDVACTWAGLNIALCSGKYVDSAFLTATAESVSLSGSKYIITDTGTRFNYSGVRQGAKIRNLDQPGLDDGIVHTSSSTTQNQVQAVAVTGGTPFAVSAGDRIRVLIASKRTPVSGGYSADGSTGPNQACSTGANFWSFIGAGDTIRLNSSTYGNPVGLITGAPSADCVTYTDLQGGSATSITAGQSFRIQYDFVEKREWEIKVRMAGTSTLESASAGMRQRSVCQGFDSDCTTMNADPLYVPDNTNPVIAFTDYDSSANVLGTASVTIPAAGAAQGSLLVGGMDLLFAEDTDEETDDGFLPRWFIRNRWQEYVFVSYADGFSPDHADDCTTGTDCITVSIPGVTSQDNRHAVAVVAGEQLAGQDRATLPVALADYFEDDNAVPGTLVFDRTETDAAFNDQLSAVIPE
jgi:hypothetical protein